MQIEQNYELPFPVAVVYAAWISSETVIEPATAMDVDPVVGGHYRLLMESDEFTAKNEGRFLEVEADSRLRYTWEWNRDGEVSEIDVTFSAAGAGTHLLIRHDGFTKPDSIAMHATGWDRYIEGLKEFLSQRE